MKSNLIYCRRNIQCLLSCKSFFSSFVNSSNVNIPNQRFWSKRIILPTVNCTNATDAVDCIQHAIKIKRLELPKSEVGLLLVLKFGLMIPVHDGLIQTQHIIIDSDVQIENSILETQSSDSLTVTLCSFHNRAYGLTSAQSDDDSESSFDGERAVDSERQLALNTALLELTDVTGDDLMSMKYYSTSPARIYKSFICPRPGRNYRYEPVDKSAQRVARQIEVSLRQVRADEALYLRNTDKSVPLQRLEQVTLNPIVLMLDNVRAAFNVGSLFRTAETVGVEELITCGISPYPPHPKLRKTALGSDLIVPTRHTDDIIQTIKELKSEGYFIVAMETATISKCYTDIQYPKKIAVIVGNEVTGVDPRVMELADVVAEIPMFGTKNSLNVASAAPIVLFEILRQWKGM